MTVQLIFNAEGGKCYKLQTFYRLCGHIETSYYHTDLCRNAIAEQLQPQRQTGKALCWSPHPLGLYRAYCVGQCETCQQAEEPGAFREKEPWRTAQRGAQPSIEGRAGQYNEKQISQRAQIARRDVEMQNRPTRTEMLEHERAEQVRKAGREVQWNIEWNRFISTNRAPRARLLELKDDFSGTRTPDHLLEIALEDIEGNPVSICQLCFGSLSEASGYTEDTANSFAVRVIGGCRHVFHHDCLYKALVNIAAQCPFCRKEYTYILKNRFDDPKYRWIRFPAIPGSQDIAPHWMMQVDGYIPFEQGRTHCVVDEDKRDFGSDFLFGEVADL